MSCRQVLGKRTRRRRGAVAVFVMVLLPVLIGFGALVIDVGVLYNTRADLQNAADAASLAAASALTGDEMMQVRMAGANSDSMMDGTVTRLSYYRAGTVAALNATWAISRTELGAGDATIGWIDLDSANSSIQPGVPGATFNAVRVVTKRTADSPNGQVELLFARVFGKSTTEMMATATAAFDDRVAGYDTTQVPGALPFTMDERVFAAQFSGGTDQFRYSSDTESVSSGSDGVREINLYPYNTAPGNFGTLNIGAPNQSASAIRAQIQNGVTSDSFVAEVGTEVLTFSDDAGAPMTYSITGNPGLRSTYESSIEPLVGQVVSFFLHSTVVGTGSGAVYTITQMRFGRVMDVQLRDGGGPRGLWIQPISFSGAGVVLSRNAPSSGGLAGRVVLVR